MIAIIFHNILSHPTNHTAMLFIYSLQVYNHCVALLYCYSQ